MKSPGFWGQKRHLSCNSNAWFLAAANFSLCWKPCNIWSRNTVQPRCLDTCNCPSRSCNKVVWFGSRVVLRSTICAKLFYAPRCFTTQKMEDEKMKCQLHMRTVCCFFSLLSFILIIDPNWNLSSKRDYTRYKPCKINWPKIDWVILTCPKIFSVWLGHGVFLLNAITFKMPAAADHLYSIIQGWGGNTFVLCSKVLL